MRRLGFAIAWEKVEGPTRCLTFLGIELDSMKYEARLPGEKIQNFVELLTQCAQRKRMSLKQLQQLGGKLVWASHILLAGRTYLKVIFGAQHGLKLPSHKRIVSSELRGVICSSFLFIFHLTC